MISNALKISSLLFAGYYFIAPAQAFVTTDVAEVAARVTATVGDALRAAEKELDKVEQNIFGLRIGKGHDETKAFLGKVDGWKTTFAKERAKIGNLGQKAVPDNQEIISKLDSQLAELGVKKSLSSAEEKVAMAIYEGNYLSKIESYKQNNENLLKLIAEDSEAAEKYKAAIQENEDNIKLLNSEFEQLKREMKAKVASKSKDIKAEIEDKIWRKGRLEEQLKNKIKEKTSVNLDDPADALKAAMKKNFVEKDAPETPENVDEVRRRRLLERRNSYLSSYSDAIMLKQRINPDIDVLNEFAPQTDNMDTMGGVIGADTQLKIKSIETMMQYAELMVSQLRIETAKEYANLRFYKIKNPDKDIAVFKLEDYGFNCGG